MLNIYYGRECIKKEKFIFDHIKGRTLLLVPDQFTLQAEKDAFFYLGVKGLTDVQVVSFSRLGLKVLKEVGGGKTPMIDKYGRHMLLAKILGEKKDELDIYRGLEKKSAFIEMANNFISELKQYGAKPDSLTEIIEELDDGVFLKRKLRDIQLVYDRYEAHIQGKYLDTEDYVDLYADKLSESALVRGSAVWVYGFDAFTPKNMRVIEQLIQAAIDVNIVMTHDKGGRDEEVFDLTGNIMRRFQAFGYGCNITPIDQSYKNTEKSPSIAALEQELYAIPVKPSDETEGITLVKAANLYAEAETAAAKVLSLVRDQKLAYRDIMVICNDMETRGSIIKRVFSQYGIDIFVDRKRSILHSPACGFVLSLLDVSVKGYRTEDVFRFLKTGLSPLNREQVEDLENYALNYKIRGGLWKRPFTRGVSQYTPEQLEDLEASRIVVTELVETFSQEFKGCKTVKEKVFVLYDFLKDKAQLPQKLETLIRRQEEQGLLDAAGETAQVWGLIVDILDQFVEVVGEEILLAESFGDILQAGLEAVEIGLLPPAADGLILGTMQRSRSSHIKALLVLGANEGILPANGNSEELLNEDEKNYLTSKEIEICKIDQLRVQEEKLAIYKNLSKPAEHLWVSYSASDIEGKESKPSAIFQKLTAIYPKLTIEKDILNRDDPMELIQAPDNTIRHMTQAMRLTIDGYELADEWKRAMKWYSKDALQKVREGLLFTNEQRQVDVSTVEKLYKGGSQLRISPSRLEQYSRCPFAHFINYGLRPEEGRVFEIAGREIGDLYHLCLMELSRVLTSEDLAVDDPDSPWMTVTKETCGTLIHEIIDRQRGNYWEGLLQSGQEEIYRVERLKEICTEMAWILVEHVRRGRIKTIEFEEAFGKGKSIPPLQVQTEEGIVLIEGKIDRIDRLYDGSVKIIDYKTGKERFDLEEARKGFRLQLMLYLKAAQRQELDPAGVFYFLISEPSVNAEGIPSEELEDKVEKSTKRAYKLDGIMVNKDSVIEGIAGDFSGYSDIVPLKKNSKGISGTAEDRLLDESLFDDLQSTVDEAVTQLCSGLVSGDIRIRPKKSASASACTYCRYKGICKFDLAFEGCRYEVI